MAGFELYIAFWVAACVLALALFLARRERHVIARRAYWQFLTEPWKVATFVAGAAVITLFAPYSGDPTWDHYDGFFMSVFCYTTAPWVVGVLYQALRREAKADQVYVAVCAWLFSASWSYDIYQMWRWGFYPITWFSNLFASSTIYLCAGLFWNLEYVPGRGVIFSFMRPGWPSRASASSFWKVALWAAVFAVPAVAAIVVFLF